MSEFYDPRAWRRLNKYGDVLQRKAEEGDTSFAPLFIAYQMRFKPGDSILDVACGAGSLAYLLEREQMPVEYTGLDVTPYYLELARKRFPGLTWVESDARELPFKDKQFDYVFSVNLLQHLVPTDVRTVLLEMTRVAKKAVFLQAEFAPSGRIDYQKSIYPNEDDGSTSTFYYNTTAYSELEIPGWKFETVAEIVKGLDKKNWPSIYFSYDPGLMAYLATTLRDREAQYVVLERKYKYP